MASGSSIGNLARVAVLAGFILAPPAQGHEPPPGKDEVKAVVRISKGLIEEVTNREIAASGPYRAKIIGLYVQGVAFGQAKPWVEIITADRDAIFVISAAGTAQSSVRAVRGPVVATGQALLPFASNTQVRFDGRNFSRLETTPWVDVHFDLENIEGRRGRLPGRVLGRLMMPISERRFVPRAEQQAVPIGEYYLKNFVDETADKIIGVLNRATPVEASLNRVYPKTKDWVFRVSTTSTYVQAAYGPRDSKVPDLPAGPKRAESAWLEFWLRSTSDEARLLTDLGKSPLARELLRKYLEATFPELAAVAADWSVSTVDSWVVIGIRPVLPK
jgi:hypothetical protein